jgi:hypothetical protein
MKEGRVVDEEHANENKNDVRQWALTHPPNFEGMLAILWTSLNFGDSKKHGYAQ